MDRLLDLIGTSVIVQALITLGVLSVILKLYATGQEVPTALLGIFQIVLGFYFGSKIENTRARRR